MTAVTQRIRRSVRRHGHKQTDYQKRISAQAQEKAIQGMELRKAGVTYGNIAKALGYSSASNAKRGIDRLMLRQTTDASHEVVLMDLARLDEFQQRCTNSLRQNNDLSQIDRLLRIMDQRYKLLGISDENMAALRESYGVSTKIDTTTNVMIVQTSQTSEAEFLSRMMQAVQIDPETNIDAAEYIANRLGPQKEIGAKKTRTVKRRIVKKGTQKKSVQAVVNTQSNTEPNTRDLYAPTHHTLSEAEIIDAEIV